MTARPRGAYRDPCLILEEKQEAMLSCLGCESLFMSRRGPQTFYVCASSRQDSVLNWNEMKRCSKYQPESP